MHAGLCPFQFLTGEVAGAWLTPQTQGLRRRACCATAGDSPAERHSRYQHGGGSAGMAALPPAGRMLPVAALRPGPAAHPTAWHQTPLPRGGAEARSNSHSHRAPRWPSGLTNKPRGPAAARSAGKGRARAEEGERQP